LLKIRVVAVRSLVRVVGEGNSRWLRMGRAGETRPARFAGRLWGSMDCPVRTAPISSGRIAIVAVAALLAGCTMCPDPYDYSGPVPNGSSPQNDFRARSNGILPVGAAPVPWPPIVKASGVEGRDGPKLAAQRSGKEGRQAVPTLADPAVESAAGDVAQIEPTSVLVTAAVEAAATEPSAAEPDHVIPVIGESDGESPESDHSTESERSETESAALTPIAPPTAPPVAAEMPPVVVEIPPFVETPGWRQRQGR